MQNYRDHQTKKPTKIEEAVKALQRNFELVVMNMRAQVRAVCIANGVSPEKFTEAFHNFDAQAAFEQKQVEIEVGMMQEAQAKALAEKEKRQQENPDQPTQPSIGDLNPTEEQLRDLIEGEGDRIE